MSSADPVIPHGELRNFVADLFTRRGLDPVKARHVADGLVDADMMGRASHGCGLAPWYLDAVGGGRMASSGEHIVVSDRGACFAWAGNQLPAAWLISQAMELCIDRVTTYGTVTASIANSFHAGALAVYLRGAVERGYMVVLSCSGPDAHWMPPFGGTAALFSTNPIAAGIPTKGQPILLDVSCSITTVNRVRQMAKTDARLAGKWGMNTSGAATDDPAEILGGGALLPIGGAEYGHKGYSFALLVEALTQGLTGFGSARNPAVKPNPVATNIFLQVIDPDAFGGGDSYREEMSWVAEACKQNKPLVEGSAVRVPGENALRLVEQSTANGVTISAAVLEALVEQARTLELQVPRVVGSAVP